MDKCVFFCRINTILMQSINISSLCVFGEKLGQRPMTLKRLLYSYDTFVLSNLVTSDMYFSGIAL